MKVDLEIKEELKDGNVVLSNGATLTRIQACKMGLIHDHVYESAHAHGERVAQMNNWKQEKVEPKDFSTLAEALRRNVELAMALLEQRASKPVYPEPIRKEAEKLLTENLARLRTL